jgi:branched-chain amino acid transport system ATP-binding protein
MKGLTVRENLTVARVFGAGRHDLRRIDEILESADLSHQADRDAQSELALQELKRLEIAKALATEPKILLLDEVLAGLETQVKRKFTQKLKDVHARFALTIVMVEHHRDDFRTLLPRGRPEFRPIDRRRLAGRSIPKS